jgi:hypothetical protein
MKPCDKVSSIRGTSALLQGRQINGEKIEERTHTEKEHRRQNREERSQKTRSKKIKGPEQRNQDRSETQHQRVITHCKRDCSDD